MCPGDGFKQTPPGENATPCYSGPINPGDHFAATQGASADMLAGSNASLNMCVSSAKQGTSCQTIATGDQTRGVTQGIPPQTPATAGVYTPLASGPLNARTLIAQINPSAEDLGQSRVVCSWAEHDGTQYMQTEQGWTAMTAPMQPAQTLTVSTLGPITLSVTSGLDLTSLQGTMAYIGMASSCEEAAALNKQGQYYTVE